MKSKNFSLIFIVVLIVVLLYGCSSGNNANAGNTNSNNVPQQPIHWHPILKIIIKGEEQFIPSGIGISIGNNIDSDISGMRMSPTHTHSGDGIIHLENNRPWQKPETLTLGYFFKVWGKNFNSSCIFDYCNVESGTLAMTVNGQPNNEFDKYMMHDKDEIVIEYK